MATTPAKWEEEWKAATHALTLMEMADDVRTDEYGGRTDGWRSLAARVACLERLGEAMPPRVRAWVARATADLDQEDRSSPFPYGLIYPDDDEVYAAFREAFAAAGPDLRQRLAAAQDVFRGTDYYAHEQYLLEPDGTSETYTGPVYAAESAVHCHLIRDIFGNPFRPITFAPEWRTSTAVALARSMYDARAFDRLPILADALEDAGGDHADLLTHCRGPGPHVRGCWAVDLVLGLS